MKRIALLALLALCPFIHAADASPTSEPVLTPSYRIVTKTRVQLWNLVVHQAQSMMACSLYGMDVLAVYVPADGPNDLAMVFLVDDVTDEEWAHATLLCVQGGVCILVGPVHLDI